MKKEQEKTMIMPSNFLTNNKNRLLDIRAQRILFYAIAKTKDYQKATFSLDEFEQYFNVQMQDFEEIKEQLYKISLQKFIYSNDQKREIRILNAFRYLDFKDELFTINFSEEIKDQIENTQKQFIKYGLQIVSQWQCKYTYLLYTYIKEKMWDYNQKQKDFTLNELKTIFKIEEDQYKRTNDFKIYVWDKVVKEINETTGFKIEIVEHGTGKKKIYTLIIHDKEELKQVKPKEEQRTSISYDLKSIENTREEPKIINNTEDIPQPQMNDLLEELRGYSKE